MSVDKKAIAKRLSDASGELFKSYPFFGRLLMRMRFGCKECGTAYTDMQSIVFDPDFADKLSDAELEFVFLHEILHCVFRHCVRSPSLSHRRFNIACDIVVNSHILDMYDLEEFEVAGEPVMHLAPDGREGREYSAEKVYYMLLKTDPEQLEKMYGGKSVDSHSVWDEILKGEMTELWDGYIRDAAKGRGVGSGIPSGLERYLRDISHNPKTNWRQLLNDYIRSNKSDYLFTSPDRRYTGDILMPSFMPDADGSSVENIWFFVDTSGSVSDAAVSEAYFEIKQAIEQIGSLSGMLAFFDTAVSEPKPFDSVDALSRIRAVGGGGTNFGCIFDYLKKYLTEQLPVAMIIITDGYAPFPQESDSLDVPVIWLIVNSDVDAPWGECVHIELE